MKKLRQILVMLLILILLTPSLAMAYTPTESEAYQRMISLQDEFYEGRPWTNANFYRWNGGYYSGGYGCAGFAFRMSDEAFGTLKSRKTSTIVYDDLKIGDILRINNDTHSVIIMEIFSDYVIIAEGNFNSSIHWGRELSRSKVEESDYVMTRYPAGMATPVNGACGPASYWAYADGVLTITGSGALWDFLSIFGTGAMDAPWAPFSADIKAVEIADGITGIGYAAFAECTALTDIYFGGTKKQWQSVTIDELNDSFHSAQLHTTFVDPGNLNTLELPADLTTIGEEAFIHLADVEKVVVPAGCQQIGSRAFANCKALQVVYLPGSTVVADDAFVGCSWIEFVYTD